MTHNTRWLPLAVFKPTRALFRHKIKRSDMMYNPKVKYEIYSRLPSHWREAYETEDPNVHQDFEVGTKRPEVIGLWKNTEFGPEPINTVPIGMKFCERAESEIWGGETTLSGLRYPSNGKKRKVLDKKWHPQVFQRKMFSEILNRNIETGFTPRALDMIDAAYGFDHFILQTHIKVLRRYGSKLKREMLLTLANKDTELYPDDAEKREKVYSTYKKYEVDAEEASWVGISLSAAMKKQYHLEKNAGYYDAKPLLEIYKEELMQKLLDQNAGHDVVKNIQLTERS